MDRDRSQMNHRGISDRRKPDSIASVNEFLELAFGSKEDGTEDVDGNNESLWESMEVKIANPIEIQEEDDEEIPLVRDDVEPDIVDADIVDANLMDANFIQDDNDENDEDVVSEDDEDDFLDRESDIDSFDRDLKEDESDDDSAHKHGPTRGLKSLREREQNPNVKPFVKIAPDMERVIGKNANCFISERSKWVKEFYPLDSRMDKDAKTRLFDKIKCYRLKEEHVSGKTITQAISNRPPEVHEDKWDWLINDWASSRHKDGSRDPEVKYEEFKEHHMSQTEKEGADNLSLKEAYLLVMKEKSGHHRGLGPGPQPPRKGRATEVMRVKVAAEIQQLQQKEAALQGQVGELQSANSELKAEIERMKCEAIERDNKLKQELIERVQT
ncbi:hypothetical protein Cgig2_002713 [Carnegiea gigantea]|uniref:Uncharacterized protein n=1 Tax=Carnegiea gigantea TaxID=171969 RepID=A0A9Q1GPL9_9CARY|nr:hypothetical protein Cgig2_002713 [Carnegiea gigantea]